MIRLGSLAGYSFEGPWLLAGWTPPDHPGLFAVMYKPEPDTKPDSTTTPPPSATPRHEWHDHQNPVSTKAGQLHSSHLINWVME